MGVFGDCRDSATSSNTAYKELEMRSLSDDEREARLACARLKAGDFSRCKHGIIDPEWCYDCFYDETPTDDEAL